MTAYEKAIEYANGLRDLAQWIEDHPDLASFYRIGAIAYPTDDAATAATWARAMKPAAKNYTDGFFTLSRKFGPVELDATFYREAVCEKVVTTREVSKLVPDPSFAVPASVPA